MTLKEKFKQIEVTVKGCDDVNPCIVSNKMFDNSAKQCEKIADDFAIGFAEWLRENYYDNGELWTEWNSDNNTHSSKELLQIYKKESGL